jgi:prepilin-type N-terminal cleavage/methylation domain-containing protein
MRTPARHAFTMIELMMAIVMGTIILFAAMGMFHTMERADAIADVRAEESTQLQRTQHVVNRAMGSLLVMSRQDQQDADAAREAREQADELPDELPEGEEPGATGEAEELPDLARPRVLLEPDPRLQGYEMTRRVRIGEQGLGAPESTVPQRLELALSAPCVIPSFADAQRRYRIAELGLAPIEIGSSVDAEGAVRGAFVFRDERRLTDLGLRVYSLWWLPVAGDTRAAEVILAEQLDPALIEGAVMLMDSVVWGRWRFFKEGEWRDRFSVLGELDLAAYGELELTTAQNVTVAWLFELAWTVGVDPEDEGDEEGDEEGEEGIEIEGGGETVELGDGATRSGSEN